jgi:chemotaxis protein methyltransferase CheR
MSPQDFKKLAELLRQRSGLVLGEDKAYLAESRLTPVARDWGFNDAAALVGALARKQGKGGDPKLIADVVEAMTTNESFFFRDQKPFDQFRDVMIPHFLNARQQKKQVRIWSAACSSGQEPYSLAMVLKEQGAKVKGWNFDIIATDLSREMLQRAEDGVYTQFEVQRGLPIQMLAKYFSQDGDKWRISPEIRKMVQFKTHNLLEDCRTLGRFDIVFCRNVLIYFDQKTKARVLSQIADLLADDGFLVLGGAETVLGISDKFKMMSGQRGLYVLNKSQGAVASQR